MPGARRWAETWRSRQQSAHRFRLLVERQDVSGTILRSHALNLEIGERFCGPPNSGNGGYVCGLVAKHLSGAVTVRLKAPPPLKTKLRREWRNDSARLLHDSAVIGEARTSELRLELPSCPTLEQAEQAAVAFPGFKSHLFPRCFVARALRASAAVLLGGSCERANQRIRT